LEADVLPPILREFPESFETERLLIRAPIIGDGAELNAAVVESFDDLRPWLPWAKGDPPTPEETEQSVRRAVAAFIKRDDLMFPIFLKGTHILVGSSGLHRMNWDVPKFEIGYWCRKRFEGQGYITEAVRGITRFAFESLGAQRVEIRCDTKNERSRRVAERCGYTLEGELRNDSLSPEGRVRSTFIFSLIPEEYGAWTK
jgi:RimJ/RimL family protein N-acetyltransferase